MKTIMKKLQKEADNDQIVKDLIKKIYPDDEPKYKEWLRNNNEEVNGLLVETERNMHDSINKFLRQPHNTQNEISTSWLACDGLITSWF